MPTAGKGQQTIRLHPAKMAILRYEPESPFPSPPPPAAGGEFYSLIRTHEELSVIVGQQHAPKNAPRKSTGWRLFQLVGPFELNEIGILASVTAPLAAAGVSIFALATWDTDYFLIAGRQCSRAIKALRAAGHTVVT